MSRAPIHRGQKENFDLKHHVDLAGCRCDRPWKIELPPTASSEAASSTGASRTAQCPLGASRQPNSRPPKSMTARRESQPPERPNMRAAQRRRGLNSFSFTKGSYDAVGGLALQSPESAMLIPNQIHLAVDNDSFNVLQRAFDGACWSMGISRKRSSSSVWFPTHTIPWCWVTNPNR